MLVNVGIGHCSYIVKLSVAHVADLVEDRVETGNLSFVLGALRANSIPAPTANYFLVAEAKDAYETEGALAKRALILSTAFLCIGIEHCR